MSAALPLFNPETGEAAKPRAVSSPCPHECVNQIRESRYATPDDKDSAEYLWVHIERYRDKVSGQRRALSIQKERMERQARRIAELEQHIADLELVMKIRKNREEA